MKKLIANFLMVVTLIGGTALLSLGKSNNTIVQNDSHTGVLEAVTENSNNSFSDVYTVRGNKTKWHKVYFEAGSAVDIELNGSGNTNLDLYFYAGNQYIAGSTDSADYETLEIDINRSGYFWIGVTNRGNSLNKYVLTVDEY